MAKDILNTSADNLNNAELRIEAADAIVMALAIYISNGDDEGPSNQVIHNALFGANLLLKDAMDALVRVKVA